MPTLVSGVGLNSRLRSAIVALCFAVTAEPLALASGSGVARRPHNSYAGFGFQRRELPGRPSPAPRSRFSRIVALHAPPTPPPCTLGVSEARVWGTVAREGKGPGP